MQEIENAMDTVQEAEVIDDSINNGESEVATGQEEQEVVYSNEDETLIADLDKMLDDMIAQSEDAPKVWPSFDKDIVHKSEQEAIALAESEKQNQMIAELEALRTQNDGIALERDEAIEALTQIQTANEQALENNKEFTELFSKLLDTPILWKLVQAVADGKNVNIPAYFEEFQKKRVGVFGEPPVTETPAIVIAEPTSTDSFLASMNNWNRIRGIK